MTHYYLYIMCGATLDEDTRFYKVGIGESSSQSRVYAYLESYAMVHGHFFVLWDNDAVDFLTKCLDSINGTLSQVIIVNGADLVWSFKEKAPAPYSLRGNKQRHDLMKRIDPAYYSMCQIRKRKG